MIGSRGPGIGNTGRARIASGLAVLAALAPAAAPARSAATSSPSKLVIIVANRLLLADLDNPALPTISRMLRRGALGLISPNCLGPRVEASVTLTAAAGTSCRGGPFLRDCFDADEVLPNGLRAADAYALNTGLRAQPGSAVCLGFPEAIRVNAELGLPPELATLGEAANRAGLKTCAVGNADLAPEVFDRTSALLAADSHGRIDVGRLRPGFRPGSHNPETPVGPLDDVEVLLSSALAGIRQADIVVVHYGNTVRLDEWKLSISDQAMKRHRTAALAALDSMLARLMAARECRNALFMLVSFSPPTEGIWNRLTPIVVYPASRAGALTSATTRTAGLIAASDFAPTALGLLGLRRIPGMTGRVAHAVTLPNKLPALGQMEERVAANQVLITPVCWVFALVGALSFTAAAVAIAFGMRPVGWLLAASKAGMLATACGPLAMLLAVLAPAGTGWYAGATAAACLAIALISLRLGKALRSIAAPVIAAFALTAAAVALDAALGGTLCKFALPSSYQLSGLRYYGVGNEYAGAVMSMAALAVIFAARRARPAALVGVTVILVLAVGGLGANYGAAAAATVTFGLVVRSLSKGGFGGRHAAAALALGIAIAAVFAILDAVTGAMASHGGRAAEQTERLGLSYLLATAQRKALLNVRLISSDQAGAAFMAFVPFLVLWFHGVQPKLRTVIADNRRISGLKAMLIGSAAAFVLNDSGVVMAGVMIAMIVLVLLYSLLESRGAPIPATAAGEEAGCRGS